MAQSFERVQSSLRSEASRRTLQLKRSLTRFSTFAAVCLALFLGLSAFAPLAHADNIVGILTHGASGSFLLRLHDSDPPLVVETTDDVNAVLASLKEGSLIIGNGRVLLSDKKVQIDVVQTVGLKELLGKWQSDKSEIFEFRSFSKLMRYGPKSNVEGAAPGPHPKVENFDYALSPDRDKSFSIFMSDTEMRMLVGTLHFVDRSILLTVYDSQTGQEAEKISLSPLPLR